MSVDDISPIAKIHAERILRGEGVTDTEMRIVTAGLMLSVDELTHVVKGLTSKLWTDDQLRKIMREEVVSWSEESLRKIIGEEVASHCAGKSKDCAAQVEPKSATWVGRMLRSFAGMRCWSFVLCLILALGGAGCATVAARSENHDGFPFASGQPYMATMMDAGVWALLCWPGNGEWSADYSDPLTYLVAPVATVCVAVDLVPSIVIDTALVPYDAFTHK